MPDTFAEALDDLIEEWREQAHKEDIVAALDMAITELEAEDKVE